MKFQIPYSDPDHPDYPGMAHYINLSNGIEVLLREFWSQLNVIRIQSTKLELGQMEDVIYDLDYDFLLHLALGYHVTVYDFTKRGRNKQPRAIWQGLEWIKFVLNRVWFDRETKCENGMHVHFISEYCKLSRKTKAKIKYFKKFLKTDHLRLEAVTDLTMNDGNYCFYSEVLDKWLKGEIKT